MGEDRPRRADQGPSFLSSRPPGEDREQAPGRGAGPPDGAPDPAARLFGRRRGKALTRHRALLVQELLPDLLIDPRRPIDPPSLFCGSPKDVWLEIGFGAGEHLAACAEAAPGDAFIGCEAFHNGVAGALASIEERGLRNVRLYEGDARDVLRALPDAALGGLYLLYPDPWPKRRQRKRRLICDATLAEFARVLRPGAPLRFATDIDDYAGWTLRRALRSPDFVWTARSASDWREPWPGWASTRYEAKALREGRTPAYLTFVRV